MPAHHLSLVGIPTCLRTVNERVFHGVNERYPSAVIDAAGCLPVLIPAIGSKIDVCQMLDRLDGLLLTGSPSNVHPSHYGAEPSHPEILHDPERDATTLPLIREAVRRDLPVLAICRGIQELNVALGGTLLQRVHEVPGRLNHRSRRDSPDGPYGPAHSVALTQGRAPGIVCRGCRGDGQLVALAGYQSSGAWASSRGHGAGRTDRGGQPSGCEIRRRRAMASRAQGP
jgi:putative glutamine amidotransferase